MALNTSGPISMGGSVAGQSINLELGRANNASISLNETAARNLATRLTGGISLQDFYGRSVTTGAFDPLTATPGTPGYGGYFVGLISHNQNGSPTHALIVAPRELGESASQLQFKTTNTQAPGTLGSFDGRVNTNAMIANGIAQYPAAQYCVNLNIGGYTDWYLPARYELEIAYYNLKPSTAANITSQGSNPFSVPRRDAAYTTAIPGQTVAVPFRDFNSQSFYGTFARRLSSTTIDTPQTSFGGGTWILTSVFYTLFSNGGVGGTNPPESGLVRAFRKFAL